MLGFLLVVVRVANGFGSIRNDIMGLEVWFILLRRDRDMTTFHGRSAGLDAALRVLLLCDTSSRDVRVREWCAILKRLDLPTLNRLVTIAMAIVVKRRG